MKPTARKKEKVQRKQLYDVRLSAPESMRWQCECSAQCSGARQMQTWQCDRWMLTHTNYITATLAPYPSHTHTQPKATRNCFGDSVLLRVTGLVMQKLEELESNARPLAATGLRGAAINPHCATMGLQGKANAIGNNWLVKSRN